MRLLDGQILGHHGCDVAAQICGEGWLFRHGEKPIRLGFPWPGSNLIRPAHYLWIA